MEFSHASSDRRQADRPRHQVVRRRLLVLAVAGLGYFGSKLTRGPEQRGLLAGCPPRAESTRALEKLEPSRTPTPSPRSSSTSARPGSPRPTSRQATGPGVAEISGRWTACEGQVLTPGQPIPLRRATVRRRRSIVTFNFGSNGWEDMPAAADELREIAQIDGVDGPHRRLRRSGRRLRRGLRRASTAHLLLATLGVVIVILLFTYRSPVLWILPIFSRGRRLRHHDPGVVYFLAKYADLTVNGQSQAILSILVIGAGTDYALLLVARYREELRRHEDRHEAMAFALHRAAPAILASAATVALGMLCLLFADMNSTAGLGPVNAVGDRGHAPGDGDPAARPAGDLRPLGLLAEAAPASARAEPTSTGIWAKVGTPDRCASRARSGWSPAVCCWWPASACSASTPTGCPPTSTYTKEFEVGRRARRSSSRPRPGRRLPTPIMVVADAGSAGAVAARDRRGRRSRCRSPSR